MVYLERLQDASKMCRVKGKIHFFKARVWLGPIIDLFFLEKQLFLILFLLFTHHENTKLLHNNIFQAGVNCCGVILVFSWCVRAKIKVRRTISFCPNLISWKSSMDTTNSIKSLCHLNIFEYVILSKLKIN